MMKFVFSLSTLYAVASPFVVASATSLRGGTPSFHTNDDGNSRHLLVQMDEQCTRGCRNRPKLPPNANMKELILNCPHGGKVDETQSFDSCPYVAVNSGGYYNIGCWDTSEVTSMKNAFQNNAEFNTHLGCWDTSEVKDMSGMFKGASNFNEEISYFDTSKVETMDSMFEDALAFNSPLDNWDTKNVRVMSDMFRGAESFDQNINSWSLNSVTNMQYMFKDATSFRQCLDGWRGDMHYIYQNVGTNQFTDMFSGTRCAFSSDTNFWYNTCC